MFNKITVVLLFQGSVSCCFIIIIFTCFGVKLTRDKLFIQVDDPTIIKPD